MPSLPLPASQPRGLSEGMEQAPRFCRSTCRGFLALVHPHVQKGSKRAQRFSSHIFPLHYGSHELQAQTLFLFAQGIEETRFSKTDLMDRPGLIHF